MTVHLARRLRVLVGAALAICALAGAATAQARAVAAVPAAAGEYARHGVPIGAMQGVFDDAVQRGYRLTWIDVYDNAGSRFVNAIFRADEGVAWRAYWGMTGASYQARFDELVGLGYRLAQVESYRVDDAVRYAAIFVKTGGPAWIAYHGLSAAQHQERFDDLKLRGFVPKVISAVSIEGRRVYAGLYLKTAVGAWEARSFLTADQYQDEFDSNAAAGRRLVYLNAYVHSGSPRFTAIWWTEPPASIRARHGLTSDGYQAQWEANTAAGFRTEAVTGYETGAGARFAAYWVR